MTRSAARILLGLPGLFISLTGLVFLVAPNRAADKLRLVASSADALSNLRGLAGAPLFAIGAVLILGAVTEKLEYARPAAIFLVALIGARLLSFAVDGAPASIASFLAVPFVAFGLMVAGHILLNRSKRHRSDGAPETAP